MNQVACPTCGAPVAFRSAASVMAVCDYCKSTLLKDADSVRNVGRMSDVLEDYSPIQLNTSGTIDAGSANAVGFVVVGRIQLRYPAGFWNEWYVLDDAGHGGWLSDASGNYVFTREVDAAQWAAVPLPPFEQITPAGPLDLGHASDGSRVIFLAGDVREARCTGGQGELPFVVGAGYTARVADFHRGAEFLTLDYSDTGPTPAAPSRPVIYRGRAVTLDELQPQLLRDPETIKDEAGRFKGKVSNLECPSCGAAIPFSPGATSHLLCPACHATIDATGSVAEVIAAAKRIDAVKTTIALGAEATIAAVRYAVIGLMRRAEVSADGGQWTEYLLYAPQKGFLWLVESDEGWEQSSVVDVWPYWYSADQALLDGATFNKLYDYRAVVKYAAGAFNWKVEVGDVTRISEFRSGNVKLAAESNESELTWSRSMPVSPQDLSMWFGNAVDAARLPQQPAPQAGPPSLFAPPAGGYRRIAKWLTILLVAVNAIPMMFSPGRVLLVVLFAIVALWLPAWILDGRDGGGS